MQCALVLATLSVMLNDIKMSSEQTKRRLIAVMAGLLSCTAVPAVWGAAASATTTTTTSPAASRTPAPRPNFGVKGPVCLCGFGVTEKQIEAAELRRRLKRQSLEDSGKTAVTDQHSNRGISK